MPPHRHAGTHLAALATLWTLAACAARPPTVQRSSSTEHQVATAGRSSAGVPGVIVMAHGGDEGWNASVEAAVAPLRDRLPVEIAFGMADSNTLEAALGRLAAEGVTRAAVVRLFVSGESFLHPTEYLLGLRSDPPRVAMIGHKMVDGSTVDPIATDLELLLAREGLAGSDEVAEIVTERAAVAGTPPGGTGVVMIGHGMGDEGKNRRVLARMQRTAGHLHDLGYAEVEVATLREDWPKARAASEERIRRVVARMNASWDTVVVIPYRVSGFGPYAQVLEGLEYLATEGFLPHPRISDWIEAQALEHLGEGSTGAGNHNQPKVGPTQ